MADITKEQIDSCVKLLTDIADTKGASGVRYSIKTTLGLTRKTLVEDHMIEKVAATATDSGEYTVRERGDDYYIFKNPNRFFNNNLINTNNSIRSLNGFQKWVLGVSTFTAIVTTIFIILTYIEQRNDTNRTELKELKAEVQTIQQSMRGVLDSLKETNSSIQKIMADTILVKKKHQ